MIKTRQPVRHESSSTNGVSQVRISVIALLFGGLCTSTGNRMLLLIIPFVCLDVYGRPTLVGVAGAAAGVGALLAPTWINRLTCYFGRSTGLMIFSLLDLTAALLCLFAAFSAALIPIPLVLSGLFTGSAAVGLDPRRQTCLTLASDLLPQKPVAVVLNADEATSKIAIQFSSLPIGFMIGRYSVGSAAMLAAIVFILGLVGYAVFWMMRPEQRRANFSGSAFTSNDRKDGTNGGFLIFLKGFQLTRPLLLRGIAIRGISSFFWFSFSLGLAVYGSERGEGARLVSTSTFAYGIGTVIGAAVATASAAYARLRARVGLGWLGTSIMFAGMGLYISNEHSVWAFAFFGGLVSPVGIGALNSLIAKYTRDVDRSRVFTQAAWSQSICSTVGSGMGGVLLAVGGARIWLILSGATVFVAVLCLWLVPESLSRRQGAEREAPLKINRVNGWSNHTGPR
ncbi:MFS transporter [Propionibacterium cyclohexanicum]